MIELIIIGGLCFVAGAAAYHQALKRRPEKLLKMLDRIKEVGE